MLPPCTKLLVWSLLRVRAAERGRCRHVIITHACQFGTFEAPAGWGSRSPHVSCNAIHATPKPNTAGLRPRVRAQGAICDYRPRLSAECGDLALALEGGAGDGVPQGSGSGGAALRVWRLEAVEHLPVSATEAAAPEAALDQVPALHPTLQQSVLAASPLR